MGTRMKIDPRTVRFTQFSVATHFKAPYEMRSLEQAVLYLESGKIDPRLFPPMRVFFHAGCIWSIGNRRLWVFRKAQCPWIIVKVVNTQDRPKVGILRDKSICDKLSNPDFVPRLSIRRPFTKQNKENVGPRATTVQHSPYRIWNQKEPPSLVLVGMLCLILLCFVIGICHVAPIHGVSK